MRGIYKNNHLRDLYSVIESPILIILILTSCENIFGPDPMPTSFESPPHIEVLFSVKFVTQTRADLTVFVGTSGNNTSVTINYGITKSYGNSKSYNLTSTSAYGSVSVPIKLTGLSSGLTYYYTIKATNKYGTTAGPEGSFATLKEGESGINFNPDLIYGSVSDIDGNTYKTIRIGTQEWMAENLKSTRFNDSTHISGVTANSIWQKLETPAYCWYDNDSVNYKLSNGALYNWFAVSSNKLCPTGWHVPTDLEWTTLIYALGGNDLAFGKLQETGTTHWFYQNPAATNSSGFTALPCGSRMIDIYSSSTSGLGQNGDWWSSTKYPDGLVFSTPGAWELPLYYSQYQIVSVKLIYSFNTNGLSVRCIKN